GGGVRGGGRPPGVRPPAAALAVGRYQARRRRLCPTARAAPSLPLLHAAAERGELVSRGTAQDVHLLLVARDRNLRPVRREIPAGTQGAVPPNRNGGRPRGFRPPAAGRPALSERAAKHKA